MHSALSRHQLGGCWWSGKLVFAFVSVNMSRATGWTFLVKAGSRLAHGQESKNAGSEERGGEKEEKKRKSMRASISKN